MSNQTISGWLFDLYPSERGITLWLVDRGGEKQRCWAPFTPFFYLRVSKAAARQVEAIVRPLPFRVSMSWECRREIYTDEECDVLRVNVHSTLRVRTVVQRLEQQFPHFVFFNSMSRRCSSISTQPACFPWRWVSTKSQGTGS